MSFGQEEVTGLRGASLRRTGVQTSDEARGYFSAGTFEMKEGFDREIDSLLRRRARGTAESRSWGDGSQGAHLDADELGAFAEGALPAAARLAAASHLADCERCRGVVVGLARVPGATAEAKHHAVPATIAVGSERTPGWRALLASLFAPRVMRFAVPVLALSLVGVVSYVALRSNKRGATETASNMRRQDSAARIEPGATAGSAASSANANQSGLTDLNANAAPSAATTAPVPPSEPRGHGAADAKTSEADPVKAEDQPSAAAPPPPPPAPPAAEGPAEMSKSAPKPVTTEEGEVARNESRDKPENKDKSARQSEPSDDLAANDAVQRGRAAQSRMNQVQMPDGGARNEKRAADSNASSGYGGGAAASAPAKESDRERAAALGSTHAARRTEKKADEDETAGAGDTRTAAGHRFRREGGAWVDVNYKPSMPSTGVRRGTEGFRALVADVPEVGRVAEAVGGEVIVVVGGRAYRIR
jgi:hypothetical protein